MRLTVLGGGGFRVPLVYGALLRDRAPGRITHVTLHDLDAGRLAVVRRVLAEQAHDVPDAPEVTATTDLHPALRGADFVFSAIRVGGLEGRAADERIALAEGVLGQETVGAGGVAYGLRTVPVAELIARRIAALAPEAWVVNFTNPAGLVTEAMARHLGDRVIGICDSPVGLARRVARVLGVADPASVRLDYSGLNHLGWLRGLYVGADGAEENLLPRLFADDALLTSFEEGRLFGADWLRSLGTVPNEYLHYYYFTREAVTAYSRAEQTRGAYLLGRQARFYDEMARGGSGALAAWDRTRAEREATYMSENRQVSGAGERAADDLESGGYENVALALMRAIARGETATLVLNVRNGATIGVLDSDAVVEVPCLVDASGPRPLPVSQPAGHETGLIAAVKAVERCVLEAAESGSAQSAVKAFALHPLVDSVQVARRLLAGYQEAHPGLAYLR
ncbi:6-phospho-beta-glucosidase [Streptomyces sannanensis]|uniref:6-phospho-beta-glucosidase n=1 Tax=Streptomyces sannanensis TaxID=285536 RepID=A0ABP6SD24_9ACTN